MVLTKDEIMEKIKAVIGDSTDDNSLSLVEDINDTFDNFTKADGEDWQKKYEAEHTKFEENDKMWREKYRDRFFNESVDDNDDTKDPITDTPDDKPLTFENLFKESE